MTRVIGGVTAGILLLALAGPLAAAPSGRVALLHFNDFHSQLEPISEHHGLRMGGAAHLAGAVAVVRETAPDALVLFAGDLFQGTAFYNVLHGEPEVEFLNLLPVDAATLGNHEFDSGIEALRAALGAARFPILAANVVVAESAAIGPFPALDAARAASPRFERGPGPEAMGEDLPPGTSRLAPPWSIHRAGDLRVGVIGVTTEELAGIVHPGLNPTLRAFDAAEAVAPWIDRLRPVVDLVVLLSHRGVREDSLLAARVPGIDVIVTGHDHRMLARPLLVANENRNGIAGTLIVAAGSRGIVLGRLDLEVVDGRIRSYAGRLLPVGPAIPPDPAVAALVERARARLGEELDEVVAYAPEGLSAEGRFAGNSPLGHLVADAMRWASGADIAVQNSGGIRASLPPGPITAGDVYTVLPFENTLVVCELSGGGVQGLCDFIAAMPSGAVKANVSGLSFAVEAGRAADVRVGGAPLDPGRTYRVAVNDFMVAGGDGYRIAEDALRSETLPRKLRDLFTDWLRGTGTVRAPDEIRIRR